MSRSISPTMMTRLHAGLLRLLSHPANDPAISCDHIQWNYGQFQARVAAIAWQLQSRGLVEGERVGIHLPRSADLLATIVACLRLGLPYVPLDPDFPVARLQQIVEEARLSLIVQAEGGHTLQGNSCHLLGGEGYEPDWPEPAEMTAAYIMFTSGSTGKPKGVVISRRALSTFLIASTSRLALDAHCRWLCITTPAFDISILEMLGALWVGGVVQMLGPDRYRDPVAVASLLDGDPQITHLQATPTFWRMLLHSGWQGRLPHALCGGEALDPLLARRLRPHCDVLWNCYGPTEATVWSMMARVEVPVDGEAILLQGSLCGYHHKVLDESGTQLPMGEEGELCILGAALATGYWQRPDLTALSFICLEGERYYRTGDRVRQVTSDSFLYLGRRDDQVKLRGFRIELGEIEVVLRSMPGVQEAAVLLQGEGELAQLIAYVQWEPGRVVNRLSLRKALAKRLPGYMVPGKVVQVTQMPKTGSGKINRKALPQCLADEGGELALATANSGRRYQ